MRAMARVPPFDRPATYEDLMKVPDVMVAEIVGDQLHASAVTVWTTGTCATDAIPPSNLPSAAHRPPAEGESRHS
jgi:hypothetical protein